VSGICFFNFHIKIGRLRAISSERLQQELCKLLSGMMVPLVFFLWCLTFSQVNNFCLALELLCKYGLHAVVYSPPESLGDGSFWTPRFLNSISG